MTSNNFPPFPDSYWLKELEKFPAFPELEKDLSTEITIVGAGITGITAAYLLAIEGYKVALIDSSRILSGTTGYTTAKMTTQHGLIFDELISNIGEEKAKLYYQSNKEALDFFKETTNSLQIDCDYKEQEAILYATTEAYESKLEKEAEAYEKLGIPGKLTTETVLDIPVKNALVMEGQVQFHPLKYLRALVQFLIEKGVRIHENTTAVKVTNGHHQTVTTKNGARILSDYVLVATHFPFHEGLSLYSTRLEIERSYVVAAKTKKPYPGGMYLQVDNPTLSLRSATIDGEELVLIGGMGHRTGNEVETSKHYEELQAFGEETFGIEEIPYHWSAQDLTTLDKVPYIGELTLNHPKIMVATGFRKWGMTNGIVAAKMFYDKVTATENPYEDLYTPTRFHAKASIPSLAKINQKAMTSFVKGKLEKPEKSPESLGVDEGGIVTVNGERKGAYKDRTGELYIVDTTCTHAGCEVNWNDGERTWDCPCHGSRFNYTGEVIEGPAEKPLKK